MRAACGVFATEVCFFRIDPGREIFDVLGRAEGETKQQDARVAFAVLQKAQAQKENR